MFSLTEPTERDVRALLERQAEAPFTYEPVGATRDGPAALTRALGDAYVVDHRRQRLGAGELAFEAAKTALGAWRMLELGWVRAGDPGVRVVPGATLAVLARLLGWWSNACRVVYTIDEPAGEIARHGFAYGTLPEHVESGEERFLVEWDHSDDGVYYDLLAFSRPRHPLAKLARPLTRSLQRRFARDSARAMVRICGGAP